ncbi:MAG: Ni/Fe hydrogenase subunit alpha [Gemmataceae bacterium]
MERIVIDPVTRIEGHAKISIFLDDAGQVRDARFHVTEFRGFERFCQGRPFYEMPGLAARICGICPVSHLLASSKAGDGILAVQIPPAAEKLRRMMNLGQIVQSHALSFFHLSGPDLFLGWDAPPAQRNVFGLIGQEPSLARSGIRLRQFGQEIIEALGGRKIHPAWTVPGGVREPLAPDHRDSLRSRLPEMKSIATEALGHFKRLLDGFGTEVQVFGQFPSLFLGLIQPDGTWEHYDGNLRVIDEHGELLAQISDMTEYQDLIGEHVEHDSFLKSPYFKPRGFPQGLYRVGPLARVNLCARMGSPAADAELAEFRQRHGALPTSSFLYHHARLIEILAALERLEVLLDDPDLTSDRLRASAGINRLVSVGVSEAPRGTLFHHYEVDEHGLLRKINLIIATGQNNLAMSRTVTQIARHFIRDRVIPEPFLNRVEAGIRAFDPCLSCSTHALGQMPLVVELRDPHGELIQEVRR